MNGLEFLAKRLGLSLWSLEEIKRKNKARAKKDTRRKRNAKRRKIHD